jgi:HPt (histidine-containing phosphotransfer) domain-containing protein
MRRKVICTWPGPHPLETGDKAFPRLAADGGGNALSMSGGADARQSGETASRLPRIIPTGSESAICWNSFAALQSQFSPADFHAMISLYLLNVDLHLMQIALSRACRDFGAVAREAHDIALLAGNLGAVDVGAAAHLLEQACRSGEHAATYGLVSALSRACDEADTTLSGWLIPEPGEREP